MNRTVSARLRVAWTFRIGQGEPLLRSRRLGEKQGRAPSDREKVTPVRGNAVRKIALFVAKLIVTGICFWYVARQIDFGQVWSAIPLLDFRWAAFAALGAMLQIPIVALRWRDIVCALGSRNEGVTRAAMIAATAVGMFFAQVLPSVAGDGVRAWLLVRLGCDWRNAVTSVVLDRVVGVGLLIALGFVTLLLPLGLTAFGEYRDVILVVYSVLLVVGTLTLWFGPTVLSPLARWRYLRWLLMLLADAHRVFLGQKGPLILALGCLVHALTIVIVWSLGRAQGLTLSISDAAVLVTIMIGVTVFPISISGWGLRELAVISLLGHHGVAPEKALLFSVCFGLAMAVGSLPGALTWILYPFGPSWRYAVESSG